MPERFQETQKHFNVIFTTEERIYDAVVESKSLCVCVCERGRDRTFNDVLSVQD